MLASFINEVVKLDDEATIEYTVPVPDGTDAGVLDVGVNGGPCGIRTHDLRIKSPMLCQLSQGADRAFAPA